MTDKSPTTAQTDQPEEFLSEEEKKIVLRKYRALLRSLKDRITGKDQKNIKKAFELANKAHSGVRRKSGEPYIYHPIEVAQIVADDIGLDANAVVCALLHDVVEDTEVTLADIEEMFDAKIAAVIDGLTKVPQLNKTESKQAETFRKIILTLSHDIRVVLIKIADRLHNMRTLDSMAKDSKLKIQAETQYVYAPLAHRLGLYNIKSELEDLCFKYTDPENYQRIYDILEKGKVARGRLINDFKKPIEEELNKQGLSYTIKARTKSISSIWTKMQKQQIDFEEVYDLFAIRIILNTEDRSQEKVLCWKAYSIVTDFYQPNLSRLRDWIVLPKSTGYESLHTTVMYKPGADSKIKKGQWVEVQIRTDRMDEIAEKGYAAHWKYKSGKDKSEFGIESWLQKVRSSLENKDLNALEFVDEFQGDLLVDEIYTYTPDGDIITLPKRSTVLDFAFEIHTEVGVRALGAKVNNKLVSLNHVLKTGDQVQILKSPKPKINRDWLGYVSTSRAKAKIRAYLKKDRSANTENGKTILMRKLDQLKMQKDEVTISKIAELYQCSTPQELYIKIGNEEIQHTEIKAFIQKNLDKFQDLSQHTHVHKHGEGGPVKSFSKKDEVVIGGDAQIEYSLAKCCTPVQGEDIIGITTVTKGIKIHRVNCPNLIQMMASHGDRIIRVRWGDEEKEEQSRFSTEIIIHGTDRIGLVQSVTLVISQEQQVNMNYVSFKTTNGIFEGNIELSVRNKKQFETIVNNLKRIDGVVEVVRKRSNEDEDS